MKGILIYNYSLLLYCVTQKWKVYKAMNIKGCSIGFSYTKYKIWVSGAKIR